MNPGIWGILIIAIVVVLLFGRGKISGLMGEVAGGIKAFQKGMREDDTPPAQIDARATTAPADAKPADTGSAPAGTTQADKSKDV